MDESKKKKNISKVWTSMPNQVSLLILWNKMESVWLQSADFFLFPECVIIVHAVAGAFSAYLYSSKIKLKPRQLLSATSKQCFEQPADSFLVCSLIFIEYY